MEVRPHQITRSPGWTPSSTMALARRLTSSFNWRNVSVRTEPSGLSAIKRRLVRPVRA